MLLPLAQAGAGNVGAFYLELVIVAVAYVAGIVAVLLPSTAALQSTRLVLAALTIVAGVAVPVAAGFSTEGGLVYLCYPVFAFPACIGLLALRRRRQVARARGFDVLTGNDEPTSK